MSETTKITLSGKEMLDVLSLITGDGTRANLTPDELETEIEITHMPAWHDKESGREEPAGLYASLADYPEEGLYGPLGLTHEARRIQAKST